MTADEVWTEVREIVEHRLGQVRKKACNCGRMLESEQAEARAYQTILDDIEAARVHYAEVPDAA